MEREKQMGDRHNKSQKSYMRERIELHCHTKMSLRDGVESIADIIDFAYAQGMPGVAITEHENIMTFIDAFCYEKYMYEEDFKLIHGIEVSMVDDEADLADFGFGGKEKSFHVSVLIVNESGRKNLYKLLTEAAKSLRQPTVIPKSMLQKYREGLVFGSACGAGEVQWILAQSNDVNVIAPIVNFFDYLEIQPVAGNMFMIENEQYLDIHSENDIRNLNRKIVNFGSEWNKPVVATCDVHYLRPEDKLYYEVIEYGWGESDTSKKPGFYFMTTEEMLMEFDYLGKEKAQEVVIDNTYIIADMIENINPVCDKLMLPKIPYENDILKELCYQKAEELYGKVLPLPVEERMEKELFNICNNGYASIYLLTKELIEKSGIKSYERSCNGTVSASFVAYLLNISEVNPLKAHYRCKKAHYSEFKVGNTPNIYGCELKDKKCPVCGKKLIKDGFNLPYESFAGIHMDYAPDINLVVILIEQQKEIIKLVGDLQGVGEAIYTSSVMRAAYNKIYWWNIVDNYAKENELDNIQKVKILKKCDDVAVSYGSTYYSILLVPKEKNICDYSPLRLIQEKKNSKIITEFDRYDLNCFYSMDITVGGYNQIVLSKLMMETGYDFQKIMFDDKEVMSLFQNTSALKLIQKENHGYILGCVGVPDFEGEYMYSILITAKPKTMRDLIKIRALGDIYGASNWIGNGQMLIESGIAQISDIIAFREDIFDYLSDYGMNEVEALRIMERVGKGKGLDDKAVRDMNVIGIPQWYIDSCNKIKALDYRATAVVSTICSWRIAYYKIHYPEAFYRVIFEMLASNEVMELIQKGKNAVWEEYSNSYCRVSEGVIEQDYNTLRLAIEMLNRGIYYKES